MSTVPASLRRYRADLVAAIDRKLDEAHPARLLREPYRPWRSRWSVLFASAAVVGTALLVLTLAAPWQGSPTLLERAQAALLAPAAGEVLYESVTVHSTSDPRRSATRARVWLDGSSPHRFRITFSGSWKAEVGGTLGTSTGLDYVASDNAIHRRYFLLRIRQSDLDPAAFVSAALSAGRAKPVGRTTLRGQRVIRFRVSEWFETARGGRLLVPVALYYVEAETYRPVRVVITPPQEHHPVILAGSLTEDDLRKLPPDVLLIAPEDPGRRLRLGFPLDPSFFFVSYAGNRGPTLPSRAVYDFEEYRLLAPTAENRKLASVRAMHPQATMP